MWASRVRKMMTIFGNVAVLALVVLSSPQSTMVDARAILGVDMGSLYMKVALVQRGQPLEIVTNLHAKRKTEQMVLFDSGARFYGADASSLLGRKPHLTPAAMTLMLGRKDDHPTAKVLAERHYPIVPKYNETRSGVCLSVDGQEFTPEELVAMVLTHAKDITIAYSGETTGTALPEVRDCVLTVPSFSTQHERRALLDAAALADFNVLGLIDENTAAALHFGIDKIQEEPLVVLFYNMGASALQVSIVKYHSYERKESKFATKGKPVGTFEVLSKTWDTTLGGQAFDMRLLEFMADDFNAKWNAKTGQTRDVRTIPRAMAKLRIEANKLKHVLSANQERQVYMENVYDDTPYQLHMTRAKFEEMCHDLLQRATLPIETAMKAANLTLAEIDAVELIGGGMRVPRIQESIKAALKDKELGMHINSDESMAMGAAFHGANVSTAFKVRHVGMTDVNPFPISITLTDLPTEEAKEKGLFGSLFGIGSKKKEEIDAAAAGGGDTKKDGDGEGDGEGEEGEGSGENWKKHATIFKSFGKVGVKKTIAFTHSDDVHCTVDYVEVDDDEINYLPPGTETSIESYNITGIAEFAKEMEEKGLAAPKVSLQFELSSSGLTTLIKAEATVEEMVIVQEEVEVEDDEAEEGKEEEKEEDASEKEEDSDASKEEKKEEEAEGAKKKEEEETESAEEAKKEDEKTESAEEAKKEEKKENEEEEKKEEAKEEETKSEEEKEGEAKKDEKAEDDDKKKKKKPKKEKKTKLVDKEKKKVHKRVLKIDRYYVGQIQPYSVEVMEDSKAKMEELARRDKERIMLEEMRNKVESYIYKARNGVTEEDETIWSVSTEEQRAAILKLANDAEEWMYEDGYDADYETFRAKYEELSTPMQAILLRASESTARPEAFDKLRDKCSKATELMAGWEKAMPHITEEERQGVLDDVEEIRKWIAEKEEEQGKLQPHEDPVILSEEIAKQSIAMEKKIAKLSVKPKPKPPKKNTTDAKDEKKEGDEEKKEGDAAEGEEKKEGEEADAEGKDGESEEKNEEGDSEGEEKAPKDDDVMDDEL